MTYQNNAGGGGGTIGVDTYYMMVEVGSNQNININSQTKVAFDTVVKDPSGGYSTSNKQWTVPIAGTYLVVVQLNFTAVTTTGTNEILLVKGGSTVVARSFQNFPGTNTLTLAGYFVFAQNDLVEIDNFMAQASTIVGGDPAKTWWNMSLVSLQ